MGPSMHWKRSVFVSGWVGEWGSGWVMKIEVSPRRRLMRNRGGQCVVAGGKSEISSFPFSASPFPFSDPQALCKEAGRQPTWGRGGREEDGVRAQMVPWTPSTLSSHLNMAATALHSTCILSFLLQRFILPRYNHDVWCMEAMKQNKSQIPPTSSTVAASIRMLQFLVNKSVFSDSGSPFAKRSGWSSRIWRRNKSGIEEKTKAQAMACLSVVGRTASNETLQHSIQSSIVQNSNQKQVIYVYHRSCTDCSWKPFSGVLALALFQITSFNDIIVALISLKQLPLKMSVTPHLLENIRIVLKPKAYYQSSLLLYWNSTLPLKVFLWSEKRDMGMQYAHPPS